MLIFELIAEQRIREAIERGELDNLPGAGKPLSLEDDPFVPAHLRVAYRMIKNAGFIPSELEARREIHSVEELVRAAMDGEERSRALRKLHLLRLRLAESRRDGPHLEVEDAYYEKVLKRLS